MLPNDAVRLSGADVVHPPFERLQLLHFSCEEVAKGAPASSKSFATFSGELKLDQAIQSR